MFYEVITGTDIMFYLMIAVGVIGGVAKVVNLIYRFVGWHGQPATCQRAHTD